jgi:hypothetical protein
MQQDVVQQGLLASSEEAAQEQYLQPGVEPLNLAIMKDFIRFYIATSRPQLTEQLTADFINTVAK